jgi:hypothetical protein
MKKILFITLLLCFTLVGMAQTKRTSNVLTGYTMISGTVTVPIPMDALYEMYIQVECTGMTFTDPADSGGMIQVMVRSTSAENWIAYDNCMRETLNTANQYIAFKNFNSSAWQYAIRFTKVANLTAGTMKIVLVYSNLVR